LISGASHLDKAIVLFGECGVEYGECGVGYGVYLRLSVGLFVT